MMKEDNLDDDDILIIFYEETKRKEAGLAEISVFGKKAVESDDQKCKLEESGEIG